MRTNRIFRLLQVLIALYLFPMILLAEEEVSVKFSFKKPNEYVCEIRNMTEYRVCILLNKEEWEQRSDLYFDIVNGTDTARTYNYSFIKDADQSRFLYLDPGEAYTVSYKEDDKWKFIKAHVFINYVVIISNEEPRIEAYSKDIDLLKIKYENHVLKE